MKVRRIEFDLLLTSYRSIRQQEFTSVEISIKNTPSNFTLNYKSIQL
jgi:hypothetical protein